ncbi:hypothetical protein Sta7437_3479 [Stanieria cyanosphaera PCC 7437]|uniref:DUF2993 domain-containing protein n=1 Tax=Stanieria cyanosphaera (strain ATCC 29371 / PCC 7437) TaxID=111780 RepID=K9XWL1_STAC7|nr:DUF2993 domain-containing protein [Stanieria cyanosphaera]AFZ36980.1 hypothetical protein Sta7437_3479 [Stanieria cyanosphaera PCC 7437]
MSSEQRLDEQAISKVAENLLSEQVEEAQELDVDIRTNPIKIVQGEVDSISITGKGLVTQQDLHVQKIELDLDGIAINLLSVLFGKIELNQPINSTGRLVMTEADLNQNLNSDYFLSKLLPLELNVDGQIVLLKFLRPMELRLPGEGKVVFSSNLQVCEKDKTQQVCFTGVIHPRTHEHPVLMEKFYFEEGQALSLEILVAFMEILKKLINSSYVNYQGTKFRIQEMNVDRGSISLEVEAQINQIPL